MQRPGRLAAVCLVAIMVVAQAFAAIAQAAAGVESGREATVQAAGGLNIRNEPTAQADILTTADDGDFVHVLAGPRQEAGEAWYAIEYDGFVGWVAGSYLIAPRDRSVVTTRGNRGGTSTRSSVWLPVPYYSQYDGTAYGRANCGPASLLMSMAAFGKHVNVTDLRRAANRMQGTTGWYDAGVAIQVLAELADQHGMHVAGLYKRGGGFDRWTFDEVRDVLSRGRLVIPQVHLASLPGQGHSSRAIDHYIVITGYEGGRFYYNDPAFDGRGGHQLAISEERLQLAWQRSDYPFAAFSIGPGAGMPSLIAPKPTEPRRSASAMAAAQRGTPAAARAIDPAAAAADSAEAPKVAAAAAPALRADPVLALPETPPSVTAALASIPAAQPASEVAESVMAARLADSEGAFVPVWSNAVTAGEVQVAIGRLPLNTGASPAQLWTMLGGAIGLAIFGARRQFGRLGVGRGARERAAAMAPPLITTDRRPTWRPIAPPRR